MENESLTEKNGTLCSWVGVVIAASHVNVHLRTSTAVAEQWDITSATVTVGKRQKFSAHLCLKREEKHQCAEFVLIFFSEAAHFHIIRHISLELLNFVSLFWSNLL